MKKYDELKLYFCKDYKINDKIVLKQPRIGDIIDFGEQEYFQMAHTLSAIPSDMKSVLYDHGIDYEAISDFELFIMLSRSFTHADTKLLLGNLDLSQFALETNAETEALILRDAAHDIVIDELIYLKISDYICKIHGFQKKVEKSGNEFTKQILIKEDRDIRERNKNEPYESFLAPLISSMVNSPGFKYSTFDLNKIGLCEFLDSVKRISIMKNVDYLMSGIYAGTVDATKINQSEMNWMRSL